MSHQTTSLVIIVGILLLGIVAASSINMSQLTPAMVKKLYCEKICNENPALGGKYCDCDSVSSRVNWSGGPPN